VKHKYQGRFDALAEADQAIFKDSAIERALRWYRQRRGMQGLR
jgi:hypothetical protein